jgi:hypothetical protein
MDGRDVEELLKLGRILSEEERAAKKREAAAKGEEVPAAVSAAQPELALQPSDDAGASVAGNALGGSGEGAQVPPPPLP